jgi:tetratricopeptide (TPR) repeat protein
MVRRIDLPLIACIALLATLGRAEDPVAESLDLISVPDVTLALPADSKVKVRWVCPPQNANQVSDTGWYDVRFTVDASGRPWLGLPRENLVLNPTRQYRFSLSHPFSNLVCLDSGALLFQTDRDLGFLGLTDQPVVRDANAVLPFQPMVSLPLPACNVHPGAGDCLYVTGPGPSGNHEVYLLEPQRGPSGGKRTLRSFRKVFECPDPINAVTGDGHVTFVAFGQVIARIGRPGRTEPEFIAHLTDEFTDLAYLPGTGLFYATRTGVGIATDDGGAWDFLRGYHAQIELRNGTLYLFLEGTLSVLAFDNAADLARHRFGGPGASPSPTPGVKVTDLRFFAPGQGPDGNDVFDTDFDNTKVSRISAWVCIQPTRKLEKKTLVTILWTHEKDSYAYSTLCDLTGDSHPSDYESAEHPCPWGPRGAGKQPPGRYTVKVLIDGVEAAGASCEVHGDTSLVQAVENKDLPTVRRLLEEGADPNQRDSESSNDTALARAALWDVRAVELLLEHGAPVSARNNRGETPLSRVKRCGSPAAAVEIAAMLIRHGADVNAVNNSGEPLLLDIARAGLPEVVELLLKHGANPNQTIKSDNGETPLLVSLLLTQNAALRSARTLELLLAYGANPNARTVGNGSAEGYSPLRAVIHTSEPQLVEILLRHGTSPMESDRFNSFLHSALQGYIETASTNRVKAQKAKDVVAILLQHGAKLRPNEEAIVADARLHPWLNQELILEILRRNDQAVLDTTDSTVPAIQRTVVNRLIGMAIDKAAAATANDGYSAALALCDQAKTRVEAWQMAAQCPLVYYNTGLLYRHLGQIAAAKENFKRYLDLAPKAPEAEQIRQLLGKL